MAINNRNPKSSTPSDLPYPLHRLNRPQNALWFVSPGAAREIAARLLKLYPGGFGVLAWSQHLFALVQPNGVIRPAKQPFVRYEMWQLANAPDTEQCPCADFIDLESGGPWSLREGKLGHHPMCQFDPHAQKTYTEAGRQAVERMGLKSDGHGGWVATKDAPAQARPDEWIKIREQVSNQ